MTDTVVDTTALAALGIIVSEDGTINIAPTTGEAAIASGAFENGNGRTLTLRAGAATSADAAGQGGQAFLRGGVGFEDGNGGVANVYGGAAPGAGGGGTANVFGGNSVTGVGGDVQIGPGVGGGGSGNAYFLVPNADPHVEDAAYWNGNVLTRSTG